MQILPFLPLIEVMIDLIDKNALDVLVGSATPRENFGPGTDRPCLTLDLDGSDGAHHRWLSDLPCPVIGIGQGVLAQACDIVLDDDTGLEGILKNIRKAPIAAMVLVQHLRASENLDLEEALTAESFAYATVQQGPEFLEWRDSFEPDPARKPTPDPPLDVDIDGDTIKLTFDDPDNLNAIGVKMRDALCEALDLALADKSYRRIHLTGNGKAFSTGGEVQEFGEISDPATAHWVRSIRLPAWRLCAHGRSVPCSCKWCCRWRWRRDRCFRATCNRGSGCVVSIAGT